MYHQSLIIMKNSSSIQAITVSHHENEKIHQIKIYLAIAFIYISFLTAIFL